MATVMIVEDERKLRELLRGYLERDGHSVVSAGTGADALRLVHATHPDLVILIHGLELGADDYITKPFSPRELVLRVRAVLRRGEGEREPMRPRSYGDGHLVINEATREVTVNGRLVTLTPTEWRIVTALATTPGRVYSRAELINRTRGHEFEGYERSVDSHVKNLRRKVELDPANPTLIVTVLGGGYRLGLSRDA